MQDFLRKLLEELDQISDVSKDTGATTPQKLEAPVSATPDSITPGAQSGPTTSADDAKITGSEPKKDDSVTPPETPTAKAEPVEKEIIRPLERPSSPIWSERPIQRSKDITPVTQQRTSFWDRVASAFTPQDSATTKLRTSQYRQTSTPSAFQTVKQYASKFLDPQRASTGTTSRSLDKLITKDQTAKDKKTELAKLDQEIKEKQKLISKLSQRSAQKISSSTSDKTKKKGILGMKRSLRESLETLDQISNQDKVDMVTLDIPLLLRIMEYAREDANDDMDLHYVTERMIELSKNQSQLSMDDYDAIVAGNQTNTDDEGRVDESDISGLLAASSLNHSYIVTAKTAEGPTKKYRVKAQSEQVAREKFLNHHNQARIINIEQEY